MSQHLRNLIGLSIGSGREGVDAALVQVEGLGLSMTPRVLKALRLPFPPDLRENFPKARQRAVGDALALAVRRVGGEEVFAVGLMTPPGGPFATAAESVADQSGVTVISGFAARDIAAGGAGKPMTAAADYLLFHSPSRSRLLIHFGAVTSLVFLPADGNITGTVAFDIGPGCRFLDGLVHRCTREKERCDLGGTRAVQGRMQEDLISHWRQAAFFQRKPSRHFTDELDQAFISQAIDDARDRGLGLNDLLCTANHFLARTVSEAVKQFLPGDQRSISLSGGGTRNGFLRQIVAAQFPGEAVTLTDDFGVPSLARSSAAAAVLAALTLDGVTGNLPLLTGASGGRLIGRIVPGDPRNWAVVSAWAAEQMSDYLQFRRAA